MTVAHDNVAGAFASTDPISWTHTPTGTPKGIVVFVVHNSAADLVVGVTYGAVAMTEAPLSPLLHVNGAEDGTLHVFFLGSGIPTGAQTVTVDATTSGTGMMCRSVSVTAATSATGIEDTSTLDSAGVANPSVTLTINEESLVYSALHSGLPNTGDVTAPAGSTIMFGNADFGATVGATMRANAVTSSDATPQFTAASDEAGMFGIAIREVALTAVGDDLDARWAVRAAIGDTADLRWAVRAVVGDTADLRWAVRTVVSDDTDLRWAVQQAVGDTADLRWAVRAAVGDDLDLRWQIRAAASDDLDARWAIRSAVSDDADLRWALRSLSGDTTDLRWAQRALASDDLDLRWALHALAAGILVETDKRSLVVTDRPSLIETDKRALIVTDHLSLIETDKRSLIVTDRKAQ